MSCVVNIGGRDCIIFLITENEDFLKHLKERREEMKTPWGMCNSEAIAQSLEQFCFLMQDQAFTKRPQPDFSARAFTVAGRICHTLKATNKAECSRKRMKQALQDTITVLENTTIDLKTVGLDQLIQRLNSLIRYQDPIHTPDYFALFVEDYADNMSAYEVV